MELTLDQALQKGLETHKLGKIEEADPIAFAGIYQFCCQKDL